ncbi:MAG TPA: valine--tRNA ligase [Candidatus Paceibacterota bacterium]|nr:valine--tRNA ligase [Candidatus Paceibacterota bacterium]
MNDKFLTPYNPQETEPRIARAWEDSGFFNPEKMIAAGIIPSDAPAFSMVLPPPNVTGTLHLGHAMMLAVQDIMVRFHRMKGDKTLWLPGTDHAAIATQSKVEKNLQKEGVRKHDLGREEFLKRVEEFAQASHDTIVSQVRRMGSSVDWSREAFTLDKIRERAVRTAFKRMYDDGLIYRGDRIINWDPKGQTTISDDELVYVDEKTKFYYFKYGPFTIGTARPETKFGDKYVVMHPDDKRYAEYRNGQKLELEWINGPITATVIKDEAIDMEFGTGVMTITPWHSAIDFEIAERHELDKEQIIDQYGKLLPIAGEFAGLKISEARPKIVEKLESKGLLVKVEEDYMHRVATAERTGGIIEPQIMKQWFVDVKKEFTILHSKLSGIADGQKATLKELMRAAVENGQIKILPDRFEKVYFHWIDNLRDWNISRQIWYGHRVPVWYKGDKIHVGVEAPQEEGWEQDPDTLDTWFSSGLWTFSTLGWPDETDDLKTYHPTTILETGYDILFFWVARMILMSTYLLGDIPFKTVYLHGLVRDAQGRKMSKSLGNIIDPVDMADKYGADATRMALIIGTGPGNDIRLSEDKIKAYKLFANKLWNITRFVLSNSEDFDPQDDSSGMHAEWTDEFENILKDVTSDIENYRFYLAGEKLYHYVWHRFADQIIEESKAMLQDPQKRRQTQAALRKILADSLKALHPFMPFITEEIWSLMPGNGGKPEDMLMVEKWPVKVQ